MFCYERAVWVEDAATGSAAGCIAAHVAQCSAAAGGSGRVVASIEQGLAMGRRSVLLIDAEAAGAGGEWRVEVGGRVIPIAAGQWAAPSSL